MFNSTSERHGRDARATPNVFISGLLVAFAVSLMTLLCVACSGCAAPMTKVTTTDSAGRPVVYEQTGTAEEASTLSIEEPTVSYWVEAEAGKGKPDFSFPSAPVSVTGKKISITGPKSFKPPAPPSPKENAEGNAVYISIGCVLLGLLAAGALGYFGFRHEAFWAVAGGVACGAGVRFISNEAAVYIALGVCALIGVLIWAWYRVRDRVPVEHGGTLKAP